MHDYNGAADFGGASVHYLQFVAERNQIVGYMTMAACAWLIWDWITTFDDEIQFVWFTKWSMSKVLFLAARYFGLLLLIVETTAQMKLWNHGFCAFYFSIVGLGTMLMLFLVEVGMQFRVYALYEGSKKILYTNGAVFLLEVGIAASFVGVERAQNLNIIKAPEPLKGCWNTQRPGPLAMTWFVALAFELYLFALVGYKAYVRFQEEGEFIGVFRLMIRDAIIWSGVITGLLAWNAFCFVHEKNGFIFLGLPWIHAASSIAGCRLVIDIRKAWHTPVDEPSIVYVARPVSTFQPQSRPGIRRFYPAIKNDPSTDAVHKLDSDWHEHGAHDSQAELIAMGSLRTMTVPQRSLSSSGRGLWSPRTVPVQHPDTGKYQMRMAHPQPAISGWNARGRPG